MLFRFSDIYRSYGGKEVLRGVSFQMNPGEKIGLVGRNGAGKTTLFRLLMGAESPDAGEVVKMKGLRMGILDQHVDMEPGDTVHTAALSAFKYIHDIETEMRRLEIQMETDHSDGVLQRYADLQAEFEHAGGFSYAARAESVLLGVGFGREQWGMDTATLSGGQKNRLGMARLLLSDADVLLLDEPTNHLDVNAVEWLEAYLRETDKAYMVISHDRYFLDRTADRIIEIENGKAVSYKGNYSKFIIERELRREQQQREYENQQAFINKTQEFIRRNIEGQKTKQARSRRNMIERMERVEAVRSEKHGGNFNLKRVERAGNNVLTTEKLAIGYGGKALATDINISLHRGGVLGVVGANGTGKTTLLKTLIGQIREVSGRIAWGTKVNIGYYSQSLDDLYEGNDVISEFRRVAPMAENVEVRSFLARFLFFGDDIEKKVRELSGGEKGRLALAKLIYSQKNVLVLDEPTNHLDIPAREALEAALDAYPGTIVTVSHDRFFLDRIASQILSFEADGTVLDYNGNYTEFHLWREGRNAGSAFSGDPKVAGPRTPATEQADHQGSIGRKRTDGTRSPSQTNDAADPQQPALSKNERARIECRISEIEKLISETEASAAALVERMSTPEVAADFQTLSDLTAQHAGLESGIRDLYAEWERLTEKLSQPHVDG